MKHHNLAIFCVVIVLLSMLKTINAQDNGKSTELKLMSYNIKFASPTYEPAWEVRK